MALRICVYIGLGIIRYSLLEEIGFSFRGNRVHEIEQVLRSIDARKTENDD